MHSRGSIRTYKEAATLIKLAQDNKMDDFDERYTHYYRSDAGGWLEIFSYRDWE